VAGIEGLQGERLEVFSGPGEPGWRGIEEVETPDDIGDPGLSADFPGVLGDVADTGMRATGTRRSMAHATNIVINRTVWRFMYLSSWAEYA
jgi:hypothetical protein